MHGSTQRHEPLTSSEALLWTIERDPALRSTIIAVFVLDGVADADRLRRRVGLAADRFPRLRARVTSTLTGGLEWCEIADWRVEHHVTHVALAGGGTLHDVLEMAGEQAGEAFDPARPLWHVTQIDGLEQGRSALVVKMHHSMTDGLGGIGLLWLLTDSDPSGHTDGGPPTEQVRRGRARTSSTSNLTKVVRDVVTDPVGAVRAVPRAALSTAKLVTPATRALSPLTSRRGLDRHLDVIDVPLAGLERAGRAVGGTINVAFMAGVVGGLRRYHELHGEVPPGLRVTMPVSVRRDGDGPGGNRFTPVRFRVPLTLDDPARYMEEIGAISRRWRSEPAIGLTDVLAGALNRLPDALTVTIFGSMLKGVDFVASNVPGPEHRLWIAGTEVLAVYGFAPPSGSALSVTLVSQLGTGHIGINADRSAVTDPDSLRESLERAFHDVVAVGRTRRRHARPAASESGEVFASRARRRLSALDAAFLEAETPNTPMHVGAVMTLTGGRLRDRRGALRMDAIRAEIESRLPLSPRMTQIVVPVPLARPVWEDAPSFDIAEHVRHVRVPAPGAEAELLALASDLQMQLLDRSRPLWEMWFVDGLADGRVGLVYKVHHAVVDGVSAADTFELLLRGRGDAAATHRPTRRPAGTLSRLAGAALDEARTTAELALTAGTTALRKPGVAVGAAVGLGRLLQPSTIAPRTSLNRPIGDRRRFVPVRFDLDELKRIGRRHDATVNDVVLALVSSGLAALFTARGEHVDHVQVLVPVSLRGEGEHDGLGNKVGALLIPLAIKPDPVAGLAAVTAATRSRKAGPEALALGMLVRSSDTWPVALTGTASRSIVHRQPFVNLVVSNVRGSSRPVSLLGAELDDIVPIVPLGGNLSLGVAVLSYAGRLVIGLNADVDTCPDVDVVETGIQDAFRQLSIGAS